MNSTRCTSSTSRQAPEEILDENTVPDVLADTPGTSPGIVALSCSPRAGGNSDHACRLFIEGVRAAGGESQFIPLRHYTVRHCISCQRCEHTPARNCFLEGTDQSGPLFRLLLQAPVLFFACPIYFYHVPSLFKAWIDRGQAFWMRRQAGDPTMLALPPRKAYLAMMGARLKGDKLFEGSLLSLKIFLQPFNITLEDPLLLYGMDGPQDLRQTQDAVERLRAMGHAAANTALLSPGAPSSANVSPA